MPSLAADNVMVAAQRAPHRIGGLVEELAALGALIPEVLILNLYLRQVENIVAFPLFLFYLRRGQRGAAPAI